MGLQKPAKSEQGDGGQKVEAGSEIGQRRTGPHPRDSDDQQRHSKRRDPLRKHVEDSRPQQEIGIGVRNRECVEPEPAVSRVVQQPAAHCRH